MAFDGIVLQGQALKIRRPKDYAPVPGIGIYTTNKWHAFTVHVHRAYHENSVLIFVYGASTCTEIYNIRNLLITFSNEHVECVQNVYVSNTIYCPEK